MSWDDYKRAVVRVSLPSGGYVVRGNGAIGACTGTYPPEVAGRSIHFVTAFNPQGVAVSAGVNEDAHQRLLVEVAERGLESWEAIGGDDDGVHTETSVAIVGLTDDEARDLGARFGQDAVFGWRPDGWLLLGCTNGRSLMTGWHSEVQESESSGPPKPTAQSAPIDEPSAVATADGPVGSTARKASADRVHVMRSSGVPDQLDIIDGDVLASISWDLGPGGGGSLGNADSGEVYLVRNEGGYHLVQSHGGEYIVDPAKEDDDGAAVDRFIADANPGDTVTLYTRNL